MQHCQFVVCEKEDLVLLLQTAIRAYFDHYTYIWSDGGEHYVAHNFSEKILSDELADRQNRFYLLYYKDEAIGFAKIVTDKAYKDFEASETLYLHRLYLKKQAAGKGIGTAFMKSMEEWARVQNKKYIWLQAMPCTPSVKFYEKLGYQTIHRGKITFPYIKSAYADLNDMLLRL